MAASYLGGNENYTAWKAKKKEVAIRPNDPQLAEGEEEMMQLLDHMAGLPTFAAISRGESIDLWREFPPDGKGHLLMRPLGQRILAEAVGYLHQDECGPKLPLDEIFAKLKKFDARGGFQDVVRPRSVWYGITYNPHRKTMSMEGRGEIGVLLLRYLIEGTKGLNEDERGTLRQKFREARSFELEDGETAAFNLDGKQVKPEEVSLPSVIEG